MRGATVLEDSWGSIFSVDGLMLNCEVVVGVDLNVMAVFSVVSGMRKRA